MYSEHECGICYLTYNTGLRCPRELHCKHSFCESCLLALSRPLGADGAAPEAGADRVIVCPLCRDTTSVSGERKLRAQLRVDESVLERLVASGVLYREEEDPKEGEGLLHCDDTGKLPEPPAEERVSLPGSRGGRNRWGCRKVWKILSGQSSRPRSRESQMTDSELRSFAMMACYMF